MDSDLEAFSRNPTNNRVVVLAFSANHINQVSERSFPLVLTSITAGLLTLIGRI